MTKPPNSKVNLDRAIQRLYGTGARFVEYRSIIANTIVGQFLPDLSSLGFAVTPAASSSCGSVTMLQ